MSDGSRSLPESFETARLLIRAPLPGDGAAVNAAIRAAWDGPDGLHCWMDWAQELPSVEQTERDLLAGRARYLAGEDFRLLLFLKGCDEGIDAFVGSSGLHDHDRASHSFEIGYWVAPRFAWQGFVTEAVQAITAFAFRELGLAAVRISADARNLRACAVPERLGWRLVQVPDAAAGTTRVYECRAPLTGSAGTPRGRPSPVR